MCYFLRVRDQFFVFNMYYVLVLSLDVLQSLHMLVLFMEHIHLDDIDIGFGAITLSIRSQDPGC